jgi:hypothetical protein
LAVRYFGPAASGDFFKWEKRMNKIDSMSAAVREVIDAYPAEHEFYGNQLKDDVVRIYPEAKDMYPDTILRMARRHRRYAFCVVNQNDSLYKKIAVIPITEQIKEVIPEPEPPIIQHTFPQPTQGFLFSFLLIIFISFGSISYNTPEPLSDRIGENVNFFTFSQNIFGKSLSLPHLRRDYFSMSSRANIRQPGKPETERHLVEAEGELYDDYSRKAQRSF